MKVSKIVYVDLELLQIVLSREKDFSKAVTAALKMWLEKELEDEEWAVKEDSDLTSHSHSLPNLYQ